MYESILNKYYLTRVFIGVNKLLALIDLLRQTEGDYRVAKFLSKMEEDG